MATNNERLDYIFLAKLNRKEQKQIDSIRQIFEESNLDCG